jgi:hypothetical protein
MQDTIAFFTEMGFNGKVSRSHENMRTEFAWMCALNADHYNYKQQPSQQYDLGIIIIPKKDPNFDLSLIKKYCKKVGVMQEGPHWYFQDYTLDKQIWYYNTLREADIIFTHNEADKKYYEGITAHSDVRVMKSLMIEDAIGEVKDVERDGVIIGGNFVHWYGGFDSYIVAASQFDKVVAPSMGRKQPGEEQLIEHLPYMTWKQWIHKLNEFKYGVHLMRTHAAGTFALNCAFLGIPCIGYEGLDTQEICHPTLTVKIGDIDSAKKKLALLKNNSYFYNSASASARENYKKYYNENKFNTTWKEQFKVS